LRYLLAIVALAVTALGAADDKQTTQQDLIGAWRLVKIEVQGIEADPFYGKGSHGLLIYDASGWFSVQIEGADRPAVKVPSARPVPGSESVPAPVLESVPARARGPAPGDADSKALNSYYAYFGTWSFDPATSTVTHHAKGALYPSEDAAVYPQHVEVVGRRMTFSRLQNGKVQTKLWERVSPTVEPTVSQQ
jgi:Lipocalin-like domain